MFLLKFFERLSYFLRICHKVSKKLYIVIGFVLKLVKLQCTVLKTLQRTYNICMILAWLPCIGSVLDGSLVSNVSFNDTDFFR
jgi:hypothetical protein